MKDERTVIYEIPMVQYSREVKLFIRGLLVGIKIEESQASLISEYAMSGLIRTLDEVATDKNMLKDK